VDARDKPGHDEFVACMPTKTIRTCDCLANKRQPQKQKAGVAAGFRFDPPF
jgi:hypothetical protein